MIEHILRFATDPTVSGILLAFGFAGLLVEMQTLHGLAALAGIGALALFFAAHAVTGQADAIVIFLALAGLAGVLSELHVTPGHGVPGILGIFALLASIVLAFGSPFAFAAAPALAIAIVLTVVLFWGAARVFPRNAFLARIAFTGVQDRTYVSAPDYRALIGHAGYATSYLRPAGYAAIDGQKVDVLTEGEFVSAGTPIVVTRVEGARVFVRPRSEPMPKSWKRP